MIKNFFLIFSILILINQFYAISLESYRRIECLSKLTNNCKAKPEGWDKKCDIINGKQVCQQLIGGLGIECDEDKISKEIKDKCDEYSTNYQMKLSDSEVSSDISLVAYRYTQCLDKKTGLCKKKPDGWNLRCSTDKNGKKICRHLVGGLGIECPEDKISKEIKDKCKEYSTNYKMKLEDIDKDDEDDDLEELSDISLVAFRYTQCLDKKTGLCKKKPDGWNLRCTTDKNGKKICRHLVGGLGIECPEDLILDEIKDECREYSTNYQMKLSDSEIGCVCTKEYRPICGVDANGNQRTFGNKCTLSCEKNFKLLHDGKCANVEVLSDISLVAVRYTECLSKFTNNCKAKPEGWDKRCEIINGKQVCVQLIGGLGIECDEDKISKEIKDKCKEYSTNYQMKLSDVEVLSDISLVAVRRIECLSKFTNNCKAKPEGWDKKCEIINGKQVCVQLIGGLGIECDEDKISKEIKDKCKDYSTNYQMKLSDSEIGCICTMEYHPICGVDANGNQRTFGNKCTLSCEKNFKFLYDGACIF